MNPIAAYTHWLHTRWPAGKPEQLPVADPDGRTNVKGLTIVGDLTGVPLLKLSANAGVRAVRQIADELDGEQSADGVLDLAIIGGGTAGFAAAIEAEERGLRYCVFEAAKPFNTIKDFPKGKPIYTYPSDTAIEGRLELHEKSAVKEGLVEDLEEQTIGQGLKWVRGNVTHIERTGGPLEVALSDPAQTPDNVNLNGTGFVTDGDHVKAKHVLVAIGRSGNYRTLDVPGEDKTDKVTHRLHDPADFAGKDVLVVGGGDSAMETAIALTKAGARVYLSYRKKEFNRPKPENQEQILALAENPEADASVEQPTDERQSTGAGDWMHDADGDADGTLTLLMPSTVTEIRDDEVDVKLEGSEESKTLPNEQVFLMIGREAPLGFFRKSGVRIRGERTAWWWTSLIAFLVFCVWLYHWKAGKPFLGIPGLGIEALAWNPADTITFVTGLLPDALTNYLRADNTLGGVIAAGFGHRSFYYTLAYSLCVVFFGIDRMMRRKTPYVKVQTLTLMAVQVIPLFLLPEIILPYLGHNGWFDGGPMGWIADQLFPGGSYWRSYGLVLAWPLMAWNWFTAEPIWAWLILGFVQTFVLIPLLVYYFGKGAYCGWICSCGALAETMGDRHREKMPHGPFWNRFNMVGQAILLFAFVLMGIRIVGWVLPDTVQATVTDVSYNEAGQASIAVDIPDDVAAANSFRVELSDGWRDHSTWRNGVIEISDPHEVAVGERVTLKSMSGEFGETIDSFFHYLAYDLPLLSWSWFVDIFWAGIIGVGMYFWFSGRVWCRFACPLAALMHIYHRFGQFAILAEKKKCISCNVCTTVCHQGIDVMSFANKGKPMKDPECVRCSACVQMCPTGVLSFGRVGRDGSVLGEDTLMASPVRMAEVTLTVNGRKPK